MGPQADPASAAKQVVAVKEVSSMPFARKCFPGIVFFCGSLSGSARSGQFYPNCFRPKLNGVNEMR